MYEALQQKQENQGHVFSKPQRNPSSYLIRKIYNRKKGKSFLFCLFVFVNRKGWPNGSYFLTYVTHFSSPWMSLAPPGALWRFWLFQIYYVLLPMASTFHYGSNLLWYLWSVNFLSRIAVWIELHCRSLRNHSKTSYARGCERILYGAGCGSIVACIDNQSTNTAEVFDSQRNQEYCWPMYKLPKYSGWLYRRRWGHRLSHTQVSSLWVWEGKLEMGISTLEIG